MQNAIRALCFLWVLAFTVSKRVSFIPGRHEMSTQLLSLLVCLFACLAYVDFGSISLFYFFTSVLLLP